ncbi:probable xyloglucan endotransglucosylase/hydrolase protein 33 [Mangifera indica]|uniref:probable xyloglucan endotransglucosylase/hydrolase protein 33 n=1 Tax=Mangifera indica TaxID=29780 RepID=UPI001CFAC662|nr:probable xyloglucan endotransglucosylase/hydrolase protein 33 [Mangifera indica]
MYRNMAFFRNKLLFCLLLFCLTPLVFSHSVSRHYTPPSVTPLTNLFTHVLIDEGFSTFFGGSNIKIINNGSMAAIALDKSSGSGLISRNDYHYGFFSAAIKLPAGISSGVVLAFYLSNANKYPHNHDEIDIELLGHDERNNWVLQTNIYANGSVTTGREEKFYFWFDPTAQHHYYSIIWNVHHIVFLVDNIPVREFPSTGAFSSVYPSKPMSVYVTIWDGSDWATHGGKYPVNYKYAPFVASMAEMEMTGCMSNETVLPNSNSCSKTSHSSSSRSDPVYGQEFVSLSEQQITALQWARSKLMFYSYCKDISRFKVMPSECK